MSNITFISNVTKSEKLFGIVPQLKAHNVKFFTMDDSTDYIIANAKDSEVLMVDAMAKIGDDIISQMPNLKLIQSEGVGYQGIDLDSAKRHNVIVCNNKGINDTAVAETTVMLILACLKNLNLGSKAIYSGNQMQFKAASFGTVRELSECTVGLVGFGDIARATAKLLNAFGCRVVYYNRTEYNDIAAQYNAEYMPLDKLLSCSDFVSMHLAVCDATRNIVSADFLNKMQNSAYLINTARGDLVDNVALKNALINGDIAGAGLDVIYPEPVKSDNILLDNALRDKLVLTPHIAGITSLTVKKLYKNGYDNMIKVLSGKMPNNIVR